MINKIKWRLSYAAGKWRLMLGMCPMCNSDAPEIDSCPVCNSYHSSRGDKFPPEKSTKEKWWREYKGAIDAKLMTMNMIKRHKQSK